MADSVGWKETVARHFNLRVTLLHVLVPLNPAAIGNSTMPQEVLAHQKEETCNCLNLSLADELRDLAVKRIVSEGDPAETIAT